MVHKGGVPPRDLSGHKYGRLNVMIRAERRGRHPYWRCRCDCGSVVEVKQSHLRDGRTRSCGCFQKEGASARRKKHGQTRTKDYWVWSNMKGRCLNPNDPAFKDYGGRGITICDRWAASFEAFIEDMGPRPSKFHTIDRIDNNGGYCKENCRWATKRQQAVNRRNTIWVAVDGQKMCAQDAARKIGIPGSIFRARLRKGWPLDRALSEPKRSWPAGRGA